MNYPLLFKIGEFSFYTHGVFAVIGIIATAASTYWLARKKLDCTMLFDNIIYSVLIGIVGARLSYYFLYRDQFSDLKTIVYLWHGGLVSYGGFILGGLALVWLLRRQRQPIARWLDLIAVTFPLGLFFGRIGEYIAGENYGITYNPNFDKPSQVPINLYEALLCLTIFVVLLTGHNFLTKKREGIALHLLVIFYTLGRFIIDYWRADEKIWQSLSLGQIVSAALFAIFFLHLGWLLIFNRKRGHNGSAKRIHTAAKRSAA